MPLDHASWRGGGPPDATSLAQAQPPAPASPPPPPDFSTVEIKTEKVAEGVYMLTGRGGNIGVSVGADGVVIVAHDSPRRRLSTDQLNALTGRTTPALPYPALPIITFSDTLTFHMNGDSVVAFHVPPAHTDADEIVAARPTAALDALWATDSTSAARFVRVVVNGVTQKR